MLAHLGSHEGGQRCQPQAGTVHGSPAERNEKDGLSRNFTVDHGPKQESGKDPYKPTFSIRPESMVKPSAQLSGSLQIVLHLPEQFCRQQKGLLVQSI